MPVKAALALMGLIEGEAVRAPLLPLDHGDRERLAATLRSLGLVEQPSGRMTTRRVERVTTARGSEEAVA